MISTGKNKLDCIGKMIKIIVLLVLQIGTKVIHVNFWDPKKDYVSLH